MINLVPKWTHDYEEFWITIRRRNLWFINIRYYVVVALIGFLVGGQFLLDFKLTATQIYAISFVTLSILIYNIILQMVRPHVGSNPLKFNSMHISLIQILLDIAALDLLVYFTGIIESPLYVFYIFHMIVGSLILPGYLVYTLCGLVIVIFAVMVFLQNLGILETHLIQGLFTSIPDRSYNFDILFLSVFAAMLTLSVMLANRIARNLLRREGQLRNAFQEMRDSEIAKQKYIMGVVHEIKTPLAAIQTMLDLCAYNYLGELNEQVEEKLARIKIRLNDALNLVNNVLRISKLRLLKITTTEDLDVEKIICNLYDMNKEKFSSKNIDFIFQDDRIEKKSFNGDRVLIELAFSNVINNSLKYSGENSKIMVVVEDTQERIIFKFIDTGVGIPERELEKVFNQFYRASNIKTANIEGTGLGLSLVKEIIERHGGKTSIKSPTEIGTLDRPGTEIIIDIPYSAEVNNPLEEKEISYDHSI